MLSRCRGFERYQRLIAEAGLAATTHIGPCVPAEARPNTQNHNEHYASICERHPSGRGTASDEEPHIDRTMDGIVKEFRATTPRHFTHSSAHDRVPGTAGCTPMPTQNARGARHALNRTRRRQTANLQAPSVTVFMTIATVRGSRGPL